MKAGHDALALRLAHGVFRAFAVADVGEREHHADHFAVGVAVGRSGNLHIERGAVLLLGNEFATPCLVFRENRTHHLL